MNEEQVLELLGQSLAHERGVIKVYEAALGCAVSPGLRDEWSRFLADTRSHEAALMGAFERLGADPERPSAGREVVAQLANSLVRAIRHAREAGDPPAAQLIASECIALAETRDHFNWQLLSQIAQRAEGPMRDALLPVAAPAEELEDDHVFHSRSRARELWHEALGLGSLDNAALSRGVPTPAASAHSLSEAH